MTKIYNKANEKPKRQMLRNVMPEAEIVLWSRLRRKQLLGYRFRRQYGIESFVVDFYCPNAKLAIEIDGDSHFRDGAQERDKERQQIIEGYGIRFLRFTNEDVRENLDGVMLSIEEMLRRLANESLDKEL